MQNLDSKSVLQTVEKLSRLFEKQFGCRMSFSGHEEFLGGDHKDLYHLLRRGEPVTAEDSIYFPVFFHEDLVGAAHVITTKQFESHTLKHLHGVIRLMIENRLSKMENIEILTELEMHLLSQQARAQSLNRDNVVKLSAYKSNPYPLPENKINKSFSFAFLIQSQDPEDIFKMALELHSRSGRYAFLPIRDLSPDTFASAEAFKKLGPISVFLSDITTLSIEQQNVLLKYYQSARDQDCPQIIAGTNVSVAALKNDARILPELLQYLSVGFLALNKPFAIYKSENLLDFFYDSLTGRTSI
jgi:hypothetical protein